MLQETNKIAQIVLACKDQLSVEPMMMPEVA